ncbi:MAG TPA: FadR/GntR family transcriptional regulator [Bacillota bacterium]
MDADTAFTAITRERIYEKIVNQIVDLIRQNKYRPGEPIPSQRELAEFLNVSRTAVREAMTVLEKAGLIEVRAGARTVVRETPPPAPHSELDFAGLMDKADLSQLLELRIMLEGEICAVATIKGTDEELAAVAEAVDRMDKAIAGGRLGADEDYTFHQRITKACHNPIVLKFWNALSDLIGKEILHCRLQSVAAGPARMRMAAQEHRDVAEALVSRDTDKAREAMRRHLASVKSRYGV